MCLKNELNDLSYVFDIYLDLAMFNEMITLVQT